MIRSIVHIPAWKIPIEYWILAKSSRFCSLLLICFITFELWAELVFVMLKFLLWRTSFCRHTHSSKYINITHVMQIEYMLTHLTILNLQMNQAVVSIQGVDVQLQGVDVQLCGVNFLEFLVHIISQVIFILWSCCFSRVNSSYFLNFWYT